MAWFQGDNGRRMRASSNGRKKHKPKRRFPAEVLTPDEVTRLMDACSPGPAGVRNRGLIAVLYRSGLRITEALSLYEKDLDAANGSVRVLNGKGGKTRVVGMDSVAFEHVQRWFVVRQQRGIDAATVFCMFNG